MRLDTGNRWRLFTDGYQTTGLPGTNDAVIHEFNDFMTQCRHSTRSRHLPLRRMRQANGRRRSRMQIYMRGYVSEQADS